MPILFITQVAIGSVCLSIGILYGIVALRGRGSPVHWWLMVAALLAAAVAFTEPIAYSATSISTYNVAFRWVITFQGLLWIAFAWFVAAYSRTTRPALLFAVTIGFGSALVIHLASPFGALFEEIQSVIRPVLPWGETYSLAVGTPDPWRWIADVATALLGVMVIDAVVQLHRDEEHRRAWHLTIPSALLLFTLVHGSLVDLSIVQSPYLVSLGFLATILTAGVDLAGDAVSASVLASEVTSKQKRWSSLLEGVKLLVVGMDRNGNIDYVNPHFTKVTGFAESFLIGTHFTELIPITERQRLEERFAATLTGQERPFTQASLRTSVGSERVISWSTVVLRDQDDVATGTLSVGTDITERHEAETARDEAMQHLAQLKKQLEEENLYLREEVRGEHGFTDIIGNSDALKYVLHRIQQVAPTDTTVLIQGETGVGKELVARGIHDASSRANAPFVRVNCAALPPNLIESELFGHEAGAFTGATRLRKGRFELANHGTVFLDEIGELPKDLQGKLLRVLEEGELERVGSSSTITLDVRVLAATNRDLLHEVESGSFRSDLYYRINVYPVTVPPLRERREDIPLLVKYFVARIARQVGRTIREVPPAVMRKLEGYDWPGNIRELQNVLERSVIVSHTEVLQLPETLVSQPAIPSVAPSATTPNQLRPLIEVEREHVLAVLQATDGRIGGANGAAEILGLHANTLRSRMEKLGLHSRRRTREGIGDRR